MVVFGKWSLWAVIILATLGIAVAVAVAGNLVIAAALVAVVVLGAIYQLREQHEPLARAAADRLRLGHRGSE